MSSLFSVERHCTLTQYGRKYHGFASSWEFVFINRICGCLTRAHVQSLHAVSAVSSTNISSSNIPLDEVFNNGYQRQAGRRLKIGFQALPHSDRLALKSPVKSR